MYLDVFTLSALVDEFMDTLVGGRIQDVLDVDQTGIGLEIYADRHRRYLYLSADPQTPRVHLLDEKLRRGLVKPTQVGLLFRRFVETGLVTHVSQPPWERIIQIDVQGPEGDVSIYIEPMERRSNLLLVQKGMILDCMRRVGPDENRYRLSLPGHDYKLPPPQTGKHNPLTLTLDDMRNLFAQLADVNRKSTKQVLVSRILGISPLLADEIIYRAGVELGHSPATYDPEHLFPIFESLVKPLGKRDWQPGIVETENGVEAYSIYPIHSMPGWHPVHSVSEAITAYYGAPVGEDAYNAAKIPVKAAIKEALTKIRARLASLERSLTDQSERETLQHSGELILAYQYTLAKGQTELRAQYDPDQPELIIKLDPTLTPLENAQAYFARYDKAKRALDDVPGLVRQNKNELAFLEQLDTDLDFAMSWPEIDEVQSALQSKGHWRGKVIKRGGGGQSAPLKIVTKDNFVIWVGRNSRQNEQVTFGKGGGQDLWLHARGVPGSHVVVKFDGRQIPESAIDQAASLAAYYSANRAEGKVLVDVTQCVYVKKIKGAAQGMVTYRNEQPRSAVPHSEQEVPES